MKRSFLLVFLAAAMTLSLGVTGCKKKPKGPTPIPGQRGGATGPGQPSGGPEVLPPIAQPSPFTEQNPPIPRDETTGLVGLVGTVDPESMDKDRTTLSAHTVYFDFDRSAIKSSEQSKLEAVASFLKENPATGVWIEGHCDERGTEAYNLSLGDRRAQASREYLINLGIDARRVAVISYGEARPADPGHDETAWGKNRRAEFIVLRPKQQ